MGKNNVKYYYKGKLIGEGGTISDDREYSREDNNMRTDDIVSILIDKVQRLEDKVDSIESSREPVEPDGLPEEDTLKALMATDSYMTSLH